MKRQFGFRRFVTPEFGAIIFWLAAVPLLLSAAFALFHSSFLIFGWLVFATVIVRVACEGMTVLFQIHDVLVEIRGLLAVKQSPVPGVVRPPTPRPPIDHGRKPVAPPANGEVSESRMNL